MEKTYKVLKLLIWVLLFAVLITGAYVLYNKLSAGMQPMGLVAETTQPTEDSRVEAPDFTVYDQEGNAHKLSDFRGKPVILNFWASWCGPCKMEMPEFQTCWETYGDEIHFLIVNLTDGSQETVETASAYLSGEGYTFPVYYDPDIDAARAYGVNAVPVTYFIDGEGYLLARYQGAIPAQVLQQGVDLLLPET